MFHFVASTSKAKDVDFERLPWLFGKLAHFDSHLREATSGSFPASAAFVGTPSGLSGLCHVT